MTAPMPIIDYINHPAELNAETLLELRQLVARYPYYQAARLVLVNNLFLLSDSGFNAEIERAAMLLPDRRTLFKMTYGDKYKPINDDRARLDEASPDRMELLIDRFLQSAEGESAPTRQPRKPTTVDAANDYTFFLEEMDDAPTPQAATETPNHTEALVDSYIQDPSPIHLPEEPTAPANNEEQDDEAASIAQEDDGFLTETLAKIYIKQGRYSKALEILYRINLNFPEKSHYFADQIRFLQKLVVNEKYAESE